MNEKQSEGSSFAKSAQAAGQIQGAVKTGKAIAGLAKGAAAGPYGVAAAFAWQNRKLIGKIIAALLMIPILFIAMLPAMIFGLDGNALTEGDNTIIMNDDEAVINNIIEVNAALHAIIQEGLTDTETRIDRDFSASGADIKEVSNPYDGAHIMNPMLIIAQYCASMNTNVNEISLENLESIVRAAKSKLFDYERELKYEMRTEIVSVYNETTGAYEDIEEEVMKLVANYTIRYNGEAYFADEIFHLSEEQKELAMDYYENMILYLGDRFSVLVGDADWGDLLTEYPFTPNPGGWISPLPSVNWRSNVSSEFGTRSDNHRGIDITAAYNAPILAMKDGVVIVASPWVNSWGIYTVINHGGGETTLYAHCSKLNVSVGDVVEQGDVVGWVGMTGVTSGEHLHLEYAVNGTLMNPRLILP